MLKRKYCLMCYNIPGVHTHTNKSTTMPQSTSLKCLKSDLNINCDQSLHDVTHCCWQVIEYKGIRCFCYSGQKVYVQQ